MVARGVQGMNRHGEPAILYLHSWALDASQSKSRSYSLRNRFRRYGPREQTMARLETIFGSYRFGSIREAFASRLSLSHRDRERPYRSSIVRHETDLSYESLQARLLFRLDLSH
jgi:hypothetical protein